ncbi:LAFA_0A06568g1_1 [Lachancea sp. 'fantastica']|nr:LAFA_0A06568g1_1 [Lachancea sp. 'fantastica']
MGSNMMGIKADFLYKNLTRIVVEKDTSVFQTLPSRKLIPELLGHMTETIPKEIFEVQDDTSQLIERLQRLASHLNSRFTGNDTYPFTIQRICEVCYHPLKYFKTHELAKFVNALERCCLVSSSLENESHAPCEKNGSDTGDVSLKRIAWVNESEEKGLATFLREIEATVCVNFGYENDDDEDDDMNHSEQIGTAYVNNEAEDDDEEDGDYIAEEELKDDEDDEDEEDGEDDEDQEFDEDDDGSDSENGLDEKMPNSQKATTEDTETTDTTHARTKGLRDAMSIDRREPVVEGAGALEEEDSTSEDDDLDAKDVFRKRKPTEMDVYDYEEKEEASITTPKKQRAINPTTTLAHSPMFAQGSAVQSASLEQQISMLVSPSSVSSSENKKITAISGEYLEKTSPLANKSGKR